MNDSTLLQLPLDKLHRSLGARMVPFAGHAMPVQYSEGVMAEHRWTRTHAGLFDVSHMGQFLVEGEEADHWLETLMPGDFIALPLGAVRYSMLLNDGGGILDDLMVTRMPGAMGLVVNGATRHDDLAHLRAHLPDGLQLHFLDRMALLALQGPEAVVVLERLVPGVSSLGFMRWARFSRDGVELSVTRCGYTGEDGFEISLLATEAEAFARLLLEQPEVRPAGLGARDSLRLDAGLPLYGHDITPETTPVEAGLSFAIAKRRRNEGGFPGSARILVELLEGPLRRRVGLKLGGRQPAREGALILAGDAQVGVVTSGGFSPTLEAPIAMGYVDAAHAAVDTPLAIEVRGKRLQAHVVPLPFWKKNYVR